VAPPSAYRARAEKLTVRPDLPDASRTSDRPDEHLLSLAPLARPDDRRERPQELADRLGMLGAPVDELVELGAGIGDVVIARVTEVRPHPNADRLRVCTVDAGAASRCRSCAARRTWRRGLLPVRARRRVAARRYRDPEGEAARRGVGGDALLGARARPRPRPRRADGAARRVASRAPPSSSSSAWTTCGSWSTSRRTGPTCSRTSASRASWRPAVRARSKLPPFRGRRGRGGDPCRWRAGGEARGPRLDRRRRRTARATWPRSCAACASALPGVAAARLRRSACARSTTSSTRRTTCSTSSVSRCTPSTWRLAGRRCGCAAPRGETIRTLDGDRARARPGDAGDRRRRAPDRARRRDGRRGERGHGRDDATSSSSARASTPASRAAPRAARPLDRRVVPLRARRRPGAAAARAAPAGRADPAVAGGTGRRPALDLHPGPATRWSSTLRPERVAGCSASRSTRGRDRGAARGRSASAASRGRRRAARARCPASAPT
jgi:hypothetical protein